tara:strand:+ start:17046 stop:18089 length:1044 start_codon:yes stop_codon:yes gene_type:complete
MSNWQQFLAEQGAQYIEGQVIAFHETMADYPDLTNTISDLSHQGILSVSGADARKFLQGQSTCDLLALAQGASSPGAICNPKGRMLTSFQAHINAEDEILLAMDRALITPTLTAIAKYAAFFKTVLTDGSADYCQLGITGPLASEALIALFPSIPAPSHSVTDSAGNLLTCLATGLFVVIVKADHAQQMWRQLTLHLRPTGLPWWHLQMIRAGIASVTAPLSEQFVPQMLNLQAIGGVSFRKGCYTGQEVVARMQYLGKLKRRTYIVNAASDTATDASSLPSPGAEIKTVTDGKVVGTVLQAAPANASGFAMLAILREAALDQTELLIADQKVTVSFADLPYEIGTQ